MCIFSLLIFANCLSRPRRPHISRGAETSTNWSAKSRAKKGKTQQKKSWRKLCENFPINLCFSLCFAPLRTLVCCRDKHIASTIGFKVRANLKWNYYCHTDDDKDDDGSGAGGKVKQLLKVLESSTSTSARQRATHMRLSLTGYISCLAHEINCRGWMKSSKLIAA